MNKLWKKRLKKFWGVDSIVTSTFYLFVGLIPNILYIAIMPEEKLSVRDIFIIFGVTIIIGLIKNTLEMMFKEDTHYDAEIRKEDKKRTQEEEKKIKEEQDRKKHEKERNVLELEKRIMEFEAEGNHQTLAEDGKLLTNLLHYIIQTYPLSRDEEHYLSHTLPKDINDALWNYKRLTEESKKDMIEGIESLIKKTITVLNERFIKKYDNEFKRNIHQRMELVEQRLYES